MKETVRKFKETVEIQSSWLNKIRGHRYYPLLIFTICALTVCCFHVWQRVRVVALVHEVSLLKQDYTSLLDNKKKLHADIARLSASSRIQQFAQDSLGLQPVPAERLLTLMPEKRYTQEPDELTQMITVLKRAAEFMPVVEETKAKADVIEDITLDSTVNGWRP